MSLNQQLQARSEGLCELCGTEAATLAYTVSPKSADDANNQVAICDTCAKSMDDADAAFHWRCLEGSIWNPEPAVQALSYRLLQQFKEEDWAANLIGSVDLDDNTKDWALSAFEKKQVHTDAFGNELQGGDTIVLTQALNVKGTNFTASKGTVVKNIRLVADNTEQVEGKINEQTIVILTKYVKKN